MAATPSRSNFDLLKAIEQAISEKASLELVLELENQCMQGIDCELRKCGAPNSLQVCQFSLLQLPESL